MLVQLHEARMGDGPDRCTALSTPGLDESPAPERAVVPVGLRVGREEVRVAPALGATLRAQSLAHLTRGRWLASELGENLECRRTETHWVPFPRGRNHPPHHD